MLPVKRLAVIGFELAVSKKSTGSAGKASRAGRPPGRDRRRAGPPPKSGARAGGLQPTGEFERGDRQNTPLSLGRHRPSTSITAVLKSAKSHKKGLPELLKNAREAYLGASENNRHIVINHLRDTASTYLECIDFVGHKAVLHNLTYITSFRLIPPPIRDDLYRRRGHCITLPSLVKIYVVGLGKLIR